MLLPCIYFNKLKPELFFPGVSFWIFFAFWEKKNCLSAEKEEAELLWNIFWKSGKWICRISGIFFSPLTCRPQSKLFFQSVSRKTHKKKQNNELNRVFGDDESSLKRLHMPTKTSWSPAVPVVTHHLPLCCCCCCWRITDLWAVPGQTLSSSSAQGLAFICRWVELHEKAQREEKALDLCM